jgi:hypothetical protein
MEGANRAPAVLYAVSLRTSRRDLRELNAIAKSSLLLIAGGA